jgi:hypothetical protein
VELRKQQRNEVFEAINEGGLDPREFKLTEEEWAQLVHEATGSEFGMRQRRIILYSLLLRSSRSPYQIFSKVAGDPPKSEGCDTWEEILNRVREWLTELKSALSTPDLWEQLRYASAAGADDSDNSAFTEDEQREIAEKLDELRARAETAYSLSDAQMTELNTKLDYLLEASKRVGRKDWRILVGGTLLTMLTDAILPTKTTHTIFLHLLDSVGHLLGHPLPKLLPSPLQTPASAS